MNRIKRYDKENRISFSLNLLFGIHSFYKYEKDIIHKFSISNSNEAFSYSITKENEVKSLQINDVFLTIKKENKKIFKEYLYNTKKETISKKLKVIFEEDREITVSDYVNSLGKKERDLKFKIKNKLK